MLGFSTMCCSSVIILLLILAFMEVNTQFNDLSHFHVLTQQVKENQEQCSTDVEPANDVRDKLARLHKLVEAHICRSTNVKERAEENITKPSTTANACMADFEPVVEKNKRMIVCGLRSEDINAQFSMKNVNEKLCTHVVLSGYFKVNPATIEITENKTLTHTLSALVSHLKTKKLKIWLSIGADGTLGPEEYSTVAKTEASRAKFIKNVMDIISLYELDGFSPRWKYPSCPLNVCMKMIKGDYANYVSLMEGFSLKFKLKGLSLVAYGTNWIMLKAMFNFEALKKLVDFWLIACFNTMGHWSSTTGIASGQKFYEDCFGNYFPVIPIETAIIGVSISYNPVQLMSAKSNAISAAIRKDFIGNANLKSFRGLCSAVNSEEGKLIFNETGKMNIYWTKDLDWVSIESTYSIRKKMELVNKFNLPGVYVEHISDDDFSGSECNCGKFPILRTINEEVRGNGQCSVPMSPTVKASLQLPLIIL